MFDLTGKSALVTGASGGIGADIARALHAAGATVGLSGTREGPLEALASDLGSRAHVLPCNLSNAEEVEGLVKRGIEAMGSVDILVNNAGITKDGLAMRMSDDDWQSVIDVNLTAVFRLSRAVALNSVVMDYVESARLRGEGMSWIVFKEIVPNILPPLITEFGLRFCFVFLTISALSFLGVGIQPPTADWG